MEYTRKRLVKIPEARNTTKKLKSDKKYVWSFEHLDDNYLVFLDETGVNLHQTRNYGYSPNNSKCFKLLRAKRGTK